MIKLTEKIDLEIKSNLDFIDSMFKEINKLITHHKEDNGVIINKYSDLKKKYDIIKKQILIMLESKHNLFDSIRVNNKLKSLINEHFNIGFIDDKKKM